MTTSPETSRDTSGDRVECPRCGKANEVGARQCSECASFLPGNDAAVVHAANAEVARDFVLGVEEAKADIEEWIGDGIGSEPRFEGARLAAAVALTRMRLAGKLLDRIGYFDPKGKPRPAAATLESANAAFLTHLRELGLTPAGAVKLREKHAVVADDFLARAARVTVERHRA